MINSKGRGLYACIREKYIMETYEEFINNILAIRGRFACGEEYHERHHITPKCLGGTDDEDNLIDLFAREHFVAHKLLSDENPDNNHLAYAFACMAFFKGGHTLREALTPEEYEAARISLGKVVSQSNRNRKWSEESKSKLKDKLSGNKNSMYGRPWWDENTPQEKIDQWKKHMSDSKHKIPVIQLTKENEFVAEYSSVRDASMTTGILEPNIIQVYNHTPHRKTAGGYKWMTKEEYLTIQNN